MEKDSISIFVGTWNMGDALPPSDVSTWIRSLGLGKTLPTALAQAHDLYAFGTQVRLLTVSHAPTLTETSHTQESSTMPEKEWTAKLKQTLKSHYDIDYEKVFFHSLWGMRLLILVKPEHTNKITHLQYSQVRTGIGNALGELSSCPVRNFCVPCSCVVLPM